MSAESAAISTRSTRTPARKVGRQSLDGEVYASPAVVDDAIELPDGRVAIAIMWNLGDDAADGDKLSTFVIFIEQDGHWLIDERYRTAPELSNEG